MRCYFIFLILFFSCSNMSNSSDENILSEKKFIKIMPTEYKLALEKMAKEKISEIIN